MASQRITDGNGFTRIAACPISSFGIFKYGAGQVGLPGDPNRVVNVYRPESEVNNAEAIASFKDIPFIDDHAMLSGFQDDDETAAPEDYGVEGVLTGNVYYDAPWLRGDIKIFSRRLQAYLAQGKEDLSLGYGCEYIIQSGTFEGQDYEVIQTKLRGNHIALVGAGRVKGARVLDGMTFCYDHLSFDIINHDKGNSMAHPANKPAVTTGAKSAQDNALEALKSLLPELQAICGGAPAEPAAAPSEPAAAPAADPVKDNIDPVSDPVIVADPVVEPAADPAAGGGDIDAIVSQVTGLLAQLKAAVGGAATDGTEPGTEGMDTNGQNAASQPAPAPASTAVPKAADSDPAALANQAGDAAFRGFYADLAVKDRIYQRVSEVVGAFDHRSMDSAQVGAYGVKKLGLTCKSGQEIETLDNYFKGVDAASKKAVQHKVTVAKDAADAASEVLAYVQGA